MVVVYSAQYISLRVTFKYIYFIHCIIYNLCNIKKNVQARQNKYEICLYKNSECKFI